MSMSDWFSLLAVIHGLFYIITGVWPLLSIDSFQRVTGPKTDLWLVRTVGAVLAVVGASIAAAAYERSPSPEVLVLAIGSTLTLSIVDIVYVGRKVIPPIYLLDAVAELALAAAWITICIMSWQ